MPSPSPVTIRDVATEAGVSVATVSRVLNGSGPVRAATRDRIHQTAHDLRYVPNVAARALSTKQTHTVGVLLPDLYGEFFSELLRGLDRAARVRHLHLLVSGVRGSAAELTQAVRALHGRVDGIVVMSPEADPDALVRSLPPGLPLVVLGGRGASLAVDNAGGARAATAHLVQLGHARIAHLRGAAGNADAEERLAGYAAAMAEAGLPPLVLAGDFTEDAGRAAVAALLALPERPTALFAANDAMAVGALAALREGGLAAPADLAIVGFDDVPLASHLTPALTTVHVPIAELGAAAVDLLNTSGPAPDSRVLPATLVVRASCGGAAPSSSPLLS